MNKGLKALDEQAAKATKRAHQHDSEQFLLCAIHLMCVDFTPDEVVKRLRAQADHLETHQ